MVFIYNIEKINYHFASVAAVVCIERVSLERNPRQSENVYLCSDCFSCHNNKQRIDNEIAVCAYALSCAHDLSSFACWN